MADTEKVRTFRISPDVVIVCPYCSDDVCVPTTIAEQVEFGDLIDAASTHKCDEGDAAQSARNPEPPMETPRQVADELFRRAFGRTP